MPVTFMTDLKDLKDYDFVQQLPLEMLFKNLGFKQAQFDQAAQKVQSNLDTLLVNAYGQDVEKRNQIINQVNQELKKFAGQDMRDPNVIGQLNSFIGQVGSSKDLVGIKMRADAYEKAQAKKERLLADGKSTISAWNDPTVAMEHYFAGGEAYNPSRRFNDQVYVDYDFNKFGEGVAKNTPELEELNRVGRYDELSKGKTHGALSENWKQSLEGDISAKRDLRGKWESQNQGTNFGEVDRLSLYGQMASAKAIYDNYVKASQLEEAKVNPDPALVQSYRSKAAGAQAALNEASAQYYNVDDAVAKETAWNKFVQDKADEYADVQMSYATKGRTLDKLEEMKQAHEYDMDKINTEIEGRRALAEAKGQIAGNLDKKQGFSILEEYKNVKKGLHDTSGEVDKASWIPGTSTKEDWDQSDFKDAYNIKTGLDGTWRPVENLPFINELFGQNATNTYDSESGNQVRVSGKQVIGTFRNEQGKIVIIVNQDGENRAEVITDNDIKDKVLNRLKGKNLPTFIDDITGYDLGTTETPAPAATGSTGSTGTSGATGGTGATATTGGQVSYNPKDSTTTFNFGN